MSLTLGNILADIGAERLALEDPEPAAGRPNGTDRRFAGVAHMHRQKIMMAEREHTVSWRHIVDERIATTFARVELADLRRELVKTAALLVQWIEAIDRRAAAT